MVLILLLTLSNRPSIGAGNSSSAPGGFLNLNVSDQAALANFIISCERKEANLAAYKAAYEDCLEAPGSTVSWWQNPYVIVGGVSVSLTVGILIGLAFR